MILSVDTLGWIFSIGTLGLILVVLIEISRSNRRREIGVMFATDKFEEKIKSLNLDEKERMMLERLVRQSSFSNKDSVLNSPLLFEEAVNFVYKLNGGVANISPTDRHLIATLRKKLGHLDKAVQYSCVSTRQFSVGKEATIVLPKSKGVEQTVHTQINFMNEVCWGVQRKDLFLSESLVGEKVLVRLNIPGEAVYSTKVNVIGIRENTMLLKHSIKLHKEQLRRWLRLAVHFPVYLEYGEKKMDGFLVDLSAGGILLSLPEQVPENSLVRIQFHLPGFGEEKLQIRILRQLHKGQLDEKMGGVAHSASFMGDFSETQEHVLQYIFQERRAQKVS